MSTRKSGPIRFVALISLSVLAAEGEAKGVPFEETGELPSDFLDVTAAIVEGTVVDVSYSYDEVVGPRSNSRLSDVVVHRGKLPSGLSELVLRPYGGYMPNGDFAGETHTPRYVPGHRVLVFLRNQQWFHSPALETWVFRIVNSQGKTFVVNRDGTAVSGLGRYTPVPGEPVVAQPQMGLSDEQLHLTATAAQLVALGSSPSFELADILSHVDTTLHQDARTLRGEFTPDPSTWSTGRWNLIPVAKAQGDTTLASEPGPEACMPTATSRGCNGLCTERGAS